MLKGTPVIEELSHTFMLKKHYQNGKFVLGSVTVGIFKEKKSHNTLTHTFILKKALQKWQFVLGSVTVGIFKRGKKKISHIQLRLFLSVRFQNSKGIRYLQAFNYFPYLLRL